VLVELVGHPQLAVEQTVQTQSFLLLPLLVVEEATVQHL
jgi:hypothetical protein